MESKNAKGMHMSAISVILLTASVVTVATSMIWQRGREAELQQLNRIQMQIDDLQRQINTGVVSPRVVNPLYDLPGSLPGHIKDEIRPGDLKPPKVTIPKDIKAGSGWGKAPWKIAVVPHFPGSRFLYRIIVGDRVSHTGWVLTCITIYDIIII